MMYFAGWSFVSEGFGLSSSLITGTLAWPVPRGAEGGVFRTCGHLRRQHRNEDIVGVFFCREGFVLTEPAAGIRLLTPNELL